MPSPTTATPESPEPGEPEFEGEFDEARAKALVANLRKDLASVKADRDAIKAERDTLKSAETERENASKTEAQRAAEELANAKAEAAAARREAWVTKAIAKHSLSDDVADFLTGDTEEAILERAERLASLGGGNAPKSDGDPAPAGRPAPELKPGHGGESEEPFDGAALAAEIRAS